MTLSRSIGSAPWLMPQVRHSTARTCSRDMPQVRHTRGHVCHNMQSNLEQQSNYALAHAADAAQSAARLRGPRTARLRELLPCVRAYRSILLAVTIVFKNTMNTVYIVITSS